MVTLCGFMTSIIPILVEKSRPMRKEINRDPDASARIFDHRTLEKDYRTLVPLLKRGMRILDVGCGTGAITKDVARAVGPAGFVVGIDNTKAFIEHGSKHYDNIRNMELVCEDVFAFQPKEKFDLVVAARVLQWIPDVKRAVEMLRTFIKPQGILSVLDYNHEALEWKPEPPASMRKFYNAFLAWRAHAGMDNRVSENVADHFHQCGLHSVEVYSADEIYSRSDVDFIERLDIWTKVAGLKQIVDEGFIDESSRMRAVEEYQAWMHGAESMTMRLKEVRGVV